MNQTRIRELRALGVLDGTKADAARIALLDIYEAERERIREHATDEHEVASAVWFYLDVVMRDTPKGRALRWAQAQARRRPS
jgi:hypothetical protein